MTIAVTGAKGRLGSCLVQSGCVPFDCDIADEKAVRETIEALAPRVLINCAAYTAVDDAEDEANHEKALRANTRGPFVLRRNFSGYMVHISSGYVFDGKAGPYLEDDEPSPVCYYGWTKLGGEAAIEVGAPNLIVRVLDLFGNGPKSDFVRQVRDHLEMGQAMPLPTSLLGTPTYVPHLVEGLLASVNEGLEGVLHLAGDETMSRYAWGRKIAETCGFDATLVEPTDQVKGKAKRPLRGGLMTEKARSLGLPVYSPLDGLRALLALDQDDPV
jgi:dTDP-4-dehydrorhamnose reductase